MKWIRIRNIQVWRYSMVLSMFDLYLVSRTRLVASSCIFHSSSLFTEISELENGDFNLSQYTFVTIENEDTKIIMN